MNPSEEQSSLDAGRVAEDERWVTAVEYVLDGLLRGGHDPRKFRDGLRRMYRDGEAVFYYLTLYNENYSMPSMPEGVEDGILKGLYKFRKGHENKKHKAHIFGSGPILREALQAQDILQERYDVSADVWSATSQNRRARGQKMEHVASGVDAQEILSGSCVGKRKRFFRRNIRLYEDRARSDRSLDTRRACVPWHRRLWQKRHSAQASTIPTG